MKDFVLVGTGLVIEADDDLKNSFLVKGSLDKNRGSLVVNSLLFYKKIHLLTDESSLIHHKAIL